jgi:hypothetical protein
MHSIDAALVTRALRDRSRDVRASAIHLSERWLREANASMQGAVLALASDSDWAVRDQLGASLAELPRAEKETAVAAFLEHNATDPIALEGATGLMPPLGANLSDDQIADVLTYILREWGQAGSPIDPGVVASVRAQTADRTRPWTSDELSKVGGGP